MTNNPNNPNGGGGDEIPIGDARLEPYIDFVETLFNDDADAGGNINPPPPPPPASSNDDFDEAYRAGC